MKLYKLSGALTLRNGLLGTAIIRDAKQYIVVRLKSLSVMAPILVDGHHGHRVKLSPMYLYMKQELNELNGQNLIVQ